MDPDFGNAVLGAIAAGGSKAAAAAVGPEVMQKWEAAMVDWKDEPEKEWQRRRSKDNMRACLAKSV